MFNSLSALKIKNPIELFTFIDTMYHSNFNQTIEIPIIPAKRGAEVVAIGRLCQQVNSFLKDVMEKFGYDAFTIINYSKSSEDSTLFEQAFGNHLYVGVKYNEKLLVFDLINSVVFIKHNNIIEDVFGVGYETHFTNLGVPVFNNAKTVDFLKQVFTPMPDMSDTEIEEIKKQIKKGYSRFKSEKFSYLLEEIAYAFYHVQSYMSSEDDTKKAESNVSEIQLGKNHRTE